MNNVARNFGLGSSVFSSLVAARRMRARNEWIVPGVGVRYVLCAPKHAERAQSAGVGVIVR